VSEALERWIQGLPLNAQFRDELRRFAGDHRARLRALGLVLAVGVTLLLTWPASAVIDLAQGPFTYKAAGTLAIVMVAYLGLMGGIRAHPGGGRFTVQQWAAYVPLPPGAYLRGALAGQLLELALFILLVMPMLVPGAMIEGASLAQLGAALAILLGTALSARLLAMALTLWLEARPVWLILAGHAALLGMFVAGGVFWGALSPLAAFYGTFGGVGAGVRAWLAEPWPGFLVTHAVLDTALFALSWWRVRALRRGAGGEAGVAAG